MSIFSKIKSLFKKETKSTSPEPTKAPSVVPSSAIISRSAPAPEPKSTPLSISTPKVTSSEPRIILSSRSSGSSSGSTSSKSQVSSQGQNIYEKANGVSTAPITDMGKLNMQPQQITKSQSPLSFKENIAILEKQARQRQVAMVGRDKPTFDTLADYSERTSLADETKAEREKRLVQSGMASRGLQVKQAFKDYAKGYQDLFQTTKKTVKDSKKTILETPVLKDFAKDTKKLTIDLQNILLSPEKFREDPKSVPKIALLQDIRKQAPSVAISTATKPVVKSFEFGKTIADPVVQDKILKDVKGKKFYYATRGGLFATEVALTGFGSKKVGEKFLQYKTGLPPLKMDSSKGVLIKTSQVIEGVGTAQPSPSIPKLRNIELVYFEKTKGASPKKVPVNVRITNEATITTRKIDKKIFETTQAVDSDIAKTKIFDLDRKLLKTKEFRPSGELASDILFLEEGKKRTVVKPNILIDNILVQQKGSFGSQNIQIKLGKDRFGGRVGIFESSKSATKTGDIILSDIDSVVEQTRKGVFKQDIKSELKDIKIFKSTPTIGDKQNVNPYNYRTRQSTLTSIDFSEDLARLKLKTKDVQKDLLPDLVRFEQKSIKMGKADIIQSPKIKLYPKGKRAGTQLVQYVELEKPQTFFKPVQELKNIGNIEKNKIRFKIIPPQKSKFFTPISFYKSNPMFDTKIKSNFRSDFGLGQKPISDTKIDSKIQTDMKNVQDTKLSSDIEFQKDVTQISLMESDTIKKQDYELVKPAPKKTGGAFKIPMPKLPVIIPKQIFSFIDKKPSIKKQEKKYKVYDVFGKRDNKWVQINDSPLPYASAWNKGARAIDNTTSATFKVIKQKKPAPIKFISLLEEKKNENLVKKFYSKGNNYVEKNKFRIDTIGEKLGLKLRKSNLSLMRSLKR